MSIQAIICWACDYVQELNIRTSSNPGFKADQSCGAVFALHGLQYRQDPAWSCTGAYRLIEWSRILYRNLQTDRMVQNPVQELTD